ncbi:hypothetical protein Fmac_027399 [Flemingia macrophylla]|uniref:Late embryogenesis abundant protein LEA-2 subgroup domain-containing protein n=1 Tax=Flemingia macrophylla TaxID=520843 RepID=A0ABD1LHK5_9FABA
MSQLNGAYYGPAIPPQPRRKSYRHRGSGGGGCLSCCCGCIFDCIISIICKILTTIIVIAAVVALLVWFIVRPNVVRFHVTEATLTQFSYDNNTLRYDLALNVSIRNPNRRVGIYYDAVEALALYDDVRFGSQILGPFYQHPKNTTFLNPVFKGQRVAPLAAQQASKLDEEKASGVYSIDAKLFITVRFKFGWIKMHSVKPKIRCELHVPLKSRNGTAAFQATECGWDFKRWWWFR